MKKSLAHLPEHKQDELKLIVEKIRDRVEPQMLILFGSYARDEWVEDTYVEDGVTYEYKSDYDILVVVKSVKIANSSDLWRKVKKSIRDFPIRTWTNIIVHTIEYVNTHLEKGHYFFTDIKKEGCMLYDDGNFELAREKEHLPADRKHTAQEHYEHWIQNATSSYRMYEQAIKIDELKKAAFELHQTAEALYSTIELVFSNYKPKSHNLEDWLHRAGGHNPAFITIFPQTTDDQKECFDLLNRAYIDARYKKRYKITKEQLEYLAHRIKKLHEITEKICKDKIESFI
ncbi:HEPN domain-containing protein [Planctomycetota bacterium]